ncbi:MAG: hypothetical protein WBF55_19740 [Syntrophobacteria bacterium]
MKRKAQSLERIAIKRESDKIRKERLERRELWIPDIRLRRIPE